MNIVVTPVLAGDQVPPTFSAIGPTRAAVDQPVRLRLQASDDSGVLQECYMIIDGVEWPEKLKTESVGPFSVSMYLDYTFSTIGTHTLVGRCTDGAGNSAMSPTLNITLSAVSDEIAPSIHATGPTEVNTGQTPIFYGSFSDNVGVTSCWFFFDGVLESSLAANGMNGTVSFTKYGLTPGTHTYFFTCVDAAGNNGTSPTQTIAVTQAPPAPGDTTPPIVNASGPASIASDQNATFIASFSDAVGVTSCRFSFDGVITPGLAANGTVGETTLSKTGMSVGAHTYSFDCSDAAGNTGTSATKTITVTAAPISGDTTPPIVNASGPATIASDQNATFIASFSDAVGVTSCRFSFDGVITPGLAANGTIGETTLSKNGMSVGAHTYSFDCSDAAGNTGSSATKTITVTAAADTTAPTVDTPQPAAAMRGSATTLSASYTDAVGVTSCSLYVDTVYVGAANLSALTSGIASRSHTFTSAGPHTVKFSCRDAAGNVRESATRTVTVTEPTITTDTTPPSVGSVSASSLRVGTPGTITATVSDSGSTISRCETWINGGFAGTMSVIGSIASHSYTFVTAGTYTFFVRCWDGAGNSTTSPTASVTATASSTPTAPQAPPTPSPVPTPAPPSGGANTQTLLKLTCPSYPVAADHPCKAVYYYGLDGKRHAFPNAQVYFTWYTDFSRVIEVSSSFLSSIPLGRNVTYRPGVRMVKFTTLNNVYAVSRNGVLRWVTSEEIAQALYGATWSRQVDDIADVFFTDYTFGSDITQRGQYSAANETQQTPSIDQNW